MRREPLTRVLDKHAGIDWAAPPGTPVIAASGGRIIAAETKDAFGTEVLIEHGAGWQTLYGGLESIEVGKGDCVVAGAVLGKVRARGAHGGPALHFEVRVGGQPIDPLSAPVIGDAASDNQ